MTDKLTTMAAGIDPDQLADRAAGVALSEPVVLARGYQSYERFVAHVARAEDAPLVQQRDLLRGGRVVGVLPIDLTRGEVVLLRQFRLAAHLATGRGDMVEIVAGRLEDGEDPADCARRECVEEIGVEPSALVPLFTLMPTPGMTDEHAQLFAGLVDASQIAARGGVDHESEETLPFRVPIATAVAAAESGGMTNALLIIALQWLALNRARLGGIFNAPIS